MRLIEVQINDWRNFQAITIAVPEDSSLVCLVGENGTGKSNILEFISAAAHHVGVASGIETRRGNPFEEPHTARFIFRVNDAYRAPLAEQVLPEHVAAAVPAWDGTLVFDTARDAAGVSTTSLVAGGIGEIEAARWLASHLSNAHRQASEINHLHLDADRAYPPIPIQPHQLAEAWSQPWESTEWTRQFSFRASRTLYEEWLKYFLALETRTATKFLSATREAARSGTDGPELVDPFAAFGAAVSEVLPHLTFAGVDTDHRTILFDTSGSEISFDKLSGGEREISFLIGQIERFQLRRGMLLLDEPELHLNPDLLRSWVAYLRDTVEDGQVWIATHSLEAVEVAGHDATFVLEREGETRTVNRADPLAERQVISVLSATLGSPAFSVSRLRFTYIEGERHTRERERFHTIVGDPATNRFIEAGSSRDVIRKAAVLRELADETGEPLRVGGVIDRDFRTQAQIDAVEAAAGVHVLRVHEVENLLLQPDALSVLLERAGADPAAAPSIIRDASDQFAGLWVLQRAAATTSLRDIRGDTRSAAGGMTWDAFLPDVAENARSIAVHQPADDSAEAFADALEAAAAEYASAREADDFWKVCMGKQALGVIAGAIGLRNRVTYERSVARLWLLGEVERSDEAVALVAYVTEL